VPTSMDELLSLLEAGDTQAFRWTEATGEVWLDLLKRRPDAAWDVAMNKRLPDEVQLVLAHHVDPAVRRWVVMHNRVAAAALEHLVNDVDAAVRADAARHAIGPHLLERLAHDRDEDVRASVAVNPETPREIVELLATDPSRWVADRARLRLA
jgi:hypothetical protein